MCSDNLHREVKKWLEQEGYSFELKVARTFKRAGFEVSQFESYVDPESKDLREIDVVAWIKETHEGLTVSFNFYIECKYAKNPWIIFRSKKQTHPLAYFSRILNEDYNLSNWDKRKNFQDRVLACLLTNVGTSQIQNSNVFTLPPEIGYGITESWKTKKDNAYIAITQITKCIHSHDYEVENEYNNVIEEHESIQEFGSSGPRKLSIHCRIGFPIIIVRGKLFECFLHENDTIDLSETTKGIIQMNRKTYYSDEAIKMPSSIINIVCESEIEDFASNLYHAARLILSNDAGMNSAWNSEISKYDKTTDTDDLSF
jgi:hypothetical protein